MGNTAKPKQFQTGTLLHPVHGPLKFLTNWKTLEIKSFYQKYQQEFKSKPQLTSSELLKISNNTPLLSNFDILISYFQHNSHSTINIFELISAIITYSSLSWENKVKLLFSVFDFDHSKSISKDELSILSRSFFKGVQIVTNTISKVPFEFETLGSDRGFFPDIKSTDCIVLQK